MNIIDFCRQACPPQETALYAAGGFLLGRSMGMISPMDGAVYMAAIRVTYLLSQKFNKEAFRYFNNKIFSFGEQILSKTPQTNSNQSSYLDRLKKNSGRLASSWVGLVGNKLPLIKQPMKFINVYLSYAAGNAALRVLGRKPIGLLTATGIFFSSTIFAALAGSSYDLAKGKRAI
ncbi:MAG TPA: hypothetical protein VGZ69_06130 [Candidatus Rhabdochlamydia sp.]|jgi:hypothetical protein|nr:hypothetical protein [Candidatus Rhabdochlamydia sp.]